MKMVSPEEIANLLPDGPMEGRKRDSIPLFVGAIKCDSLINPILFSGLYLNAVLNFLPMPPNGSGGRPSLGVWLVSRV